ncbi:MAG TPA: hypothetical protein VMK13_15100 [Streptosporangiaceae bacterium]|nr:hypothetical protein [Streptosporangiaceae bacterium]
MRATRLDWIVFVRALAAALAQIPGVTFHTGLRPHWLAVLVDLISRGLAPVALVLAAAALVWLCITGDWTRGGHTGEARGGLA